MSGGGAPPREGPAAERDGEAPPPFGGSWGRLYAAVILWLLVQIGLFYLFTRAFS